MKIKTLIIVAALLSGSLYALQSEAPQEAAAPAAKEDQPKPRAFVYRFDYTLTELSGKQRINTRKFEILATRRGEMNTSSRVQVPIGTASGANTQFMSLDVGLRTSMSVSPGLAGEIDLVVDVAMTFVPVPETGANSPQNLQPSTRTIKMNVDTYIKPGVPTVLGTIEDVASTHSYELSVTANPR